ncbi:hypothetical protein [Kitasatospora purpeofusca]|uniref:hypothetical protein n=1 Tax=Kitasatospora purpeofusca TaxID=67352 RepID=UPI00225050B7|nr:hypothetical protein [Kitasatospora purpeofusca]MCX4752917.1 hypothetical protein [Kitasatospora purpeofusca]WSR32460.1 hypothetical protein OG715_16590 [Kitasatospora purpeofusca]
MANQHKHPVRGLRGIDDDLWADFATATANAESDRSAEVRQFIEWYVHRPGAQRPERPAQEVERPSG